MCLNLLFRLLTPAACENHHLKVVEGCVCAWMTPGAMLLGAILPLLRFPVAALRRSARLRVIQEPSVKNKTIYKDYVTRNGVTEAPP